MTPRPFCAVRNTVRMAVWSLVALALCTADASATTIGIYRDPEGTVGVGPYQPPLLEAFELFVVAKGVGRGLQGYEFRIDPPAGLQIFYRDATGCDEAVDECGFVQEDFRAVFASCSTEPVVVLARIGFLRSGDLRGVQICPEGWPASTLDPPVPALIPCAAEPGAPVPFGTVECLRFPLARPVEALGFGAIKALYGPPGATAPSPVPLPTP